MRILSALYVRTRAHHTIIKTVGRFLISGTLGAGCNIGLLYVLTEYARLYYLASACVSFVCAAGIGFALQKFWTFRDHSIERMHLQAFAFFSVTVGNFGINIALLYVLVEGLHIWYILAQAISSVLIACSSFFLYRYGIFAREAKLHPARDVLCSREDDV